MDQSTALAYGMPAEKQEVTLQFNKITGALISAFILPEGHDISGLGGQDLFVFVNDKMSLQDDQVVGKYPDYKIVANADLPTRIFESDMDLAAQTKITKHYPAIKQVNIVSDAIMKIAEKVGVELPELQELRALIEEVKSKNAVRKEFYANSPDYEYISNEQRARLEEEQLEGGVHELFGPRQVTGGRVF